MGDEFYALVKMTKGRVKEYLGADKEKMQELLALAEKEAGSPSIQKLDE
jgi:hypothetical protein